jgi:hypothetical protein
LSNSIESAFIAANWFLETRVYYLELGTKCILCSFCSTISGILGDIPKVVRSWSMGMSAGELAGELHKVAVPLERVGKLQQ